MTLPKLHARKATLDDVDMLDQWRTETAAYIKERYGHDQWQNHYSRERLTRWIEEDATELFSFTEGGEPVGTITTSLNGDINYWTIDQLLEPALYLYRTNVEPLHMGRKVGESMMWWAQSRAQELGVIQMRLEVWETAGGLRQYYEKLGFSCSDSRSRNGVINYAKTLEWNE